MYVCMYVCMYIYIYVCVCVCMCVCVKERDSNRYINELFLKQTAGMGHAFRHETCLGGACIFELMCVCACVCVCVCIFFICYIYYRHGLRFSSSAI